MCFTQEDGRRKMNLSKPQQLIYDMEKFSGGAIAVICGSILCDGEIDLSLLRQSVNEIFRINDALRIRISEVDDRVCQNVMEYSEQEIEVLHFDNRKAFHAYAQDYAKVPLDLYGNLCESKIVLLPGQYGLLVKLHHMIGDAWTLALLGNQLHHILCGKGVDAYSYTDYVENEKIYLQSKRYEKDKTYFVEQFRKCDEVTYLSEKQNDTCSAGRKTYVIDSEKTKQIMGYVEKRETSAFVLFMTALSVYMSRIKMNAEKFYIGTAVLNRNGIKEKNTAGMFINTVPMLVELNNEKTFAENLSDIQATVFSILRHQKYNYGDVLSTIRKEYGFQEKLYDVMISYQNAKVISDNFETTWYHSGAQSESLQIHIDDRDNEGIFRIHYDYLLEKFAEYEIDRLHEHICNLLFDAIENDNKKIYELEILSSGEKNKLLYEFNDTAVDYPREKCIHQLFEEQVEKTPDKVAVVADDKILTYAELNEQANSIAHSLIEKGIGVGDIVAFALPKKSYLIATILGILKSGAAYLPIDSKCPQDRIKYMLSDSNAKLFVRDSNIAGLYNEKRNNIDIKISREARCYCIYTSGSTGKPKGAQISIGNLTNYLESLIDIYGKPHSMPFFTAENVDLTVTSIYLPLITGGKVFVYDTDLMSNLKNIIENIEITAIKMTPTHMKILNKLENKKTLSNVNYIILGGEQLFQSDVEEFKQYYGNHLKIHNEYGPTETTVGSTNTGIDNFTCLYEQFSTQVKKSPDKMAVLSLGKTLTYAELEEMVEEYSSKLQTIGVQKDDVVAIHLNRSYELIVFQLAVLKQGAIFLPVDKRYPADRIRYMCNDCKVKALISDEVTKLENVNLIFLDTFKKIKPIYTSETVRNNGICYIIYTSGSTGNPKGCMLTGKGLVNFCKNNNTLKTLRQKENNIFACVNSVSFDYFIAESLLTLVNGYTTVVLDDAESTSQQMFLSAVKKHNINVLMTTPTRLKLFFDSKNNCEILKQLDCICTAGEVLPPELLEMMYSKSPKAQVYNPLGPSECSVWNVGGELEREKGIDIHIGKPIANTQIYIVDKYMKPTPIGVTGELCIAGAGVGAGYLNRPELTAEKFIDNQFGEGKLYKTGDLAYWREDGNIAYVGRNDFQVKIRGLRIELGEIENAICSIVGISHAVVVVRKNNEGRQLICAFYTGEEVDAKEIRNYIGKKLPKYMLPHICTHLKEIPLTSSGKINRKELPEVNLQNITSEIEYVAPENQQQKELCKLIEVVLATSPVGITDDFFDLGGDSLKAIEFVSKAHNEGIYFNLQNIFDYPTVKELCECIANGDKQEISFADVDFSETDKILEKNKPEHIKKPTKTEVGNILLAGATGYLGIHILADYLDNDTGTAYCLVRGKDESHSIKRLQDLLCFYFRQKYVDMSRIKVVCADLQEGNFGLTEEVYETLVSCVDTVINAAASVKHYGSYKYFYEANVETTKRLIEFCRTAKAKLIHTSTLSVSGNSFGDQFDGYISETEKYFYESSLYIGQPLENVYARSKFEAEKVVLDAMTNGLQANIMRMGNLTNRFADGVFQKNHESNAFLQRIKSVLELGLVPDYLMELYAEFTPIDEAARAIMTITRNFSTEQTVFHINSIKVVYMDKLLEIFNTLGFELKMVNGAEFTEALRQTAKQSGMEHIFETFINDMDENDKLNYDSNIRIENDFTVQYLKILGFEWPDIDLEYMRKYVEYFKKMEYIGEKYGKRKN